MYLIDTDILIYSFKGLPSVVAHFEATREAVKVISVISYGELLFGAMKSARPQENLVKARQVGKLFPLIDVTPDIMEIFGDIKARLQSKGTPLDDFDLIVAATALASSYCLVTNNERHFKRVPGLQIENWAA